MKAILFILALFLMTRNGTGSVVTYPAAETLIKSPFYQVEVSQDEKNFSSFVYYSPATFKDLDRSSSWTTFSFDGEIEVVIDLGEKMVNSCEIRPLAKKIIPTYIGSVVRFRISEPMHLAIVVNGDVQNPLFIFADPLEEAPRTGPSEDVIYFGPGIHEAGIFEIPEGTKEIYLAGGAYVKGAFLSGGKLDGLVIRGRGILSAEIFPKIFNHQRSSTPNWKELNPHNIYLGDSSGENITVEGITLIDGPMYSLIIRQRNSVARNVKCFGWYYNSDGIGIGTNGLVEHCFFRCNDDAVKVYANGTIVRECVFWQNDNGAPFQISWNLKTDNHGFKVYDCDVVYCEHSQEANNRAIFNAIHGGEGNLHDYLFENIRIDGDVFRLFKLTIQTSPSDGDEGYGSISDMTFRNINLSGKCLQNNEIWGHDEFHRISNVTFENLSIDGKLVTNAEEGHFNIDPRTTSNIQF